MKQFFKYTLIVLSALSFMSAYAEQEIPQLPLDASVRTDTLANGLRYYIRTSPNYKDEVDCVFAAYVGSANETDSQLGYARLIQNVMSLDCGKNASVKSTTDYTIANISRSHSVDSCLNVMRQWAGGLVFTDKKINAARNLQYGELAKLPLELRLANSYSDKIFANSCYVNRLPDGNEASLYSATPATVSEFYHTWYRPNIQCVVVCGDVNVDEVEKKIRDVFGSLKNPSSVKPLPSRWIPDAVKPVVCVSETPNQEDTFVELAIRLDELPRAYRNTLSGIVQDFSKMLAENIFKERLAAIVEGENAPFNSATVSFSGFFYNTDLNSFTLKVKPNNNDIVGAVVGMENTVRGIGSYGYSPDEVRRAKDALAHTIINQYENRDRISNYVLAMQCIGNYLIGSYILSAEAMYEIMNATFHRITPREVTSWMSFVGSFIESGNNTTILIYGPQKNGFVLPNEETVATIYENASTVKLEAPVFPLRKATLIAEDKLPQQGSILKEEIGKFGEVKMTLSNGAVVHLRQSDILRSEVVMTAVANGGESLYDSKDHTNIQMINQLWGINGVGDLSNQDMIQKNHDYSMKAGLNIGTSEDGIVASCDPVDIESMLQLVYLNMTSQRNDETSFDMVRDIAKRQISIYAQNPQYVFQDSLLYVSHGRNPKSVFVNDKMPEACNYQRMYEIVKERFSNAANFTFVISGNYDESVIRDYIKQYIASIPGDKSKRSKVKYNACPQRNKGNEVCEFKHSTKNGLATICVQRHAPIKLTIQNYIAMRMLGSVLGREIERHVREEANKEFDQMVEGYIDLSGKPEAVLSVTLQCKPEDKDMVLQAIDDCIEHLGKRVDPEYLFEFKQRYSMQLPQSRNDNTYWTEVIDRYARYGIDTDTDYLTVLTDLMPPFLESLSRKILSKKSRTAVIMMPE